MLPDRQNPEAAPRQPAGHAHGGRAAADRGQRTTLRYRVTRSHPPICAPIQSEKGEQVDSLWTGPATVLAGPAPVEERGESRIVEERWDLGPLNLPRWHRSWPFHASASDYQPQIGQSPQQRISIIAPGELEDRLAEQQAFLLGRIGSDC